MLMVGDESYEEETTSDSTSEKNKREKEKFLKRVSDGMLRRRYDDIVETHKETKEELKAIIDSSFGSKERVIIISHSQGNIYANDLINDYRKNGKDEEIKRTGVLNIATPTTSTATDWYYTSHDDKIINIARNNLNDKILPGKDINAVLPRKKNPRDFFNHGFAESYFHENLKSKEKIDEQFFKYCKELPFWPTEYYLVYNYVATITKKTVELLQKDGTYALISVFPPYDQPPSTSSNPIKISNVIFRDNIPLFRITVENPDYYGAYVFRYVYLTNSRNTFVSDWICGVLKNGELLMCNIYSFYPSDIGEGLHFYFIPAEKWPDVEKYL
jgi:hypothetical protein